MPVCTYQYAELGLFFTMPFVGIRIILFLIPHFAASKPDEILGLSTGDHQAYFYPYICTIFFLSIPNARLTSEIKSSRISVRQSNKTRPTYITKPITASM